MYREETLTTEKRATVYKTEQQSIVNTVKGQMIPMTGPLVMNADVKPTQSRLYQDIQTSTANRLATIHTQPISTIHPSQPTISPQQQQAAQTAQAISQIVQQPRPYVAGRQTPIYHEVHVYNKQIEVVPREQVEALYLQKQREVEEQLQKTTLDNIRLRSVQASEKISITEDTTRVNQLQTQIEQLVLLTKQQSFEIESWKNKYVEFEAQVHFQYGLEVDYMRIKNQLQETEIVLRANIHEEQGNVKMWQEKYKELEKKIYGCNEDLEHVAKNKDQRIKEAMTKITMLTSEIERLQSIQTQKTTDIEKWKKKFSETDVQGMEKDRQLNLQNEEIHKLQEQIDKLYAENQNQRQKQIDPTQFQQQINLLNQDLDAAHEIIEQRTQDIETYKDEIFTLKAQARDTTALNDLRDKLNEAERQLRKERQRLADREATITQLEDVIRHKDQQIFELSNKTTVQTTYKEERIHKDETSAVWEKRYNDLRQKYNIAQDALVRAEAELDTLKQKGFETQKINSILNSIRPAIQ